ncbi:hypothetical protein MTP99_002399 [Tenebrio molitor]|uniref:Uncharacterized protein n=1 Tax=Tenebrio molitor TaxID=7067 RepID=A0A8J6LFU5_TENMO|nr:hypothetical protein GEV33_005103 [Tenebrio molitor]KAJ3621847.1 hypothetical protein MTP99_002399 [Tenebrio molitor]
MAIREPPVGSRHLHTFYISNFMVADLRKTNRSAHVDGTFAYGTRELASVRSTDEKEGKRSDGHNNCHRQSEGAPPHTYANVYVAGAPP